MGNTIRLYDPDLLEFDRIRAEVLEEPDPGPEQEGCDADLDLVEFSRAQQLLGYVRARNAYIPVPAAT